MFGSIASSASNRLTTFVFPDMTIKEIRSLLLELDMLLVLYKDFDIMHLTLLAAWSAWLYTGTDGY